MPLSDLGTTLHFCGHHQVAIIIKGVGHFVVGEGHLFRRGDGYYGDYRIGASPSSI
jgi:hypothetical protein